ncbi:Oleosin [Nymphaea thermarum]|nr:Oleosin [Nymphaea thermarum]
MADRHSTTQGSQQRATRTGGDGPVTGGGGGGGGGGVSAMLSKLQGQAPNSTQFISFLALVISGGILLLLTGLTLTATVLALIVFTPLLLLTSPIWVPAGTLFLFAMAGFLALCGFGVAALGGGTWMYKYFRGRHPPGSDRADYARSRIADTASHFRDYAREYGGYIQSRVKDAAPGA